MEKHVLKIKMDKFISDYSFFTENHPFIKEFKAMSHDERMKALIDLTEIYANEIESTFASGMDIFQKIETFLMKEDIKNRKN